MTPRAENVETARVLGYLGRDNVLYCSPPCAAERGQPDAAPVDDDEYQALADRGSLARGLVCSACGSEFPLDLSVEDEP
jgi:hypothetical protein